MSDESKFVYVSDPTFSRCPILMSKNFKIQTGQSDTVIDYASLCNSGDLIYSDRSRGADLFIEKHTVPSPFNKTKLKNFSEEDIEEACKRFGYPKEEVTELVALAKEFDNS